MFPQVLRHAPRLPLWTSRIATFSLALVSCASPSSDPGSESRNTTPPSEADKLDPDEQEYQERKASLKKRRIACGFAEGLQAASDGRSSGCAEQLAAEERLLEAQRTLRVENERDRRALQSAVQAVQDDTARRTADELRRWLDELRLYTGDCAKSGDTACLAEAAALCASMLPRSNDQYLLETCDLLRRAKDEAEQAAADSQGATESRRRAAIAESQTAPPWNCYAAWSSGIPVGTCAISASDCAEQQKRARAIANTKADLCKPQPLAACVGRTLVLAQKTSVLCFESIAACEALRSEMMAGTDYSNVGVCDIVPTTWMKEA